MTPDAQQPQREYIINEILVSDIETILLDEGLPFTANHVTRRCRSRQHTPAPANGNLMGTFPNTAQLIEMAHTEWKNREERRGIHNEQDFCAGWITGYLTRQEGAARAATLKTLDDAIKQINGHMIETCNPTGGIISNWEINSKLDAYGWVLEMIESLRRQRAGEQG